jgi:hypothetical protein
MGSQFVVQVENRPGALARLVGALAARGVNMVHCAAGGAGSLGYAVLETEDDEVTRDVLRSTGVSYVEGSPLTVELPNRPGALASVVERLGRAGIDIRGLLTVGRTETAVTIAILVDDPPLARTILGLD